MQEEKTKKQKTEEKKQSNLLSIKLNIWEDPMEEEVAFD